MAVKIVYKVVRLEGPEDKLEDQLNAQSPWILATLLPLPRLDARGTYLAIFYKQTQDGS